MLGPLSAVISTEFPDAIRAVRGNSRTGKQNQGNDPWQWDRMRAGLQGGHGGGGGGVYPQALPWVRHVLLAPLAWQSLSHSSSVGDRSQHGSGGDRAAGSAPTLAGFGHKQTEQVPPQHEEELLSLGVAQPWPASHSGSGVSLSGDIPTPPRHIPCPRSRLGWTVPRGPSCDSVNWWDVTVRISKGHWGCCASRSSLPVPVPRRPFGSAQFRAVPGRQGRPIPCPYSFLGSSLARIRIQGSTGSWPGPGATARHSRGATGATTQPQKAPFANHRISNQKKGKKKKKGNPPKKAFCQSSPWSIPADLVEVTD
nr:uncharacterized protein LOC121470391 [Taeniopygia guttata]